MTLFRVIGPQTIVRSESVMSMTRVSIKDFLTQVAMTQVPIAALNRESQDANGQTDAKQLQTGHESFDEIGYRWENIGEFPL